MVGLVAAGHGVSLLPRLAQPEFVNEPIVLRPVAGVSPVRRIGAQIRAGTADQPHIAPVLASLRRIAARSRWPGGMPRRSAEPVRLDSPGRLRGRPGDWTPRRAVSDHGDRSRSIRGINVGTAASGWRWRICERCSPDLGYDDVRTLLNSGNAVFTTTDAPGAVAPGHRERADEKTRRCRRGCVVRSPGPDGRRPWRRTRSRRSPPTAPSTSSGSSTEAPTLPSIDDRRAGGRCRHRAGPGPGSSTAISICGARTASRAPPSPRSTGTRSSARPSPCGTGTRWPNWSTSRADSTHPLCRQEQCARPAAAPARAPTARAHCPGRPRPRRNCAQLHHGTRHLVRPGLGSPTDPAGQHRAELVLLDPAVGGAIPEVRQHHSQVLDLQAELEPQPAGRRVREAPPRAPGARSRCWSTPTGKVRLVCARWVTSNRPRVVEPVAGEGQMPGVVAPCTVALSATPIGPAVRHRRGPPALRASLPRTALRGASTAGRRPGWRGSNSG